MAIVFYILYNYQNIKKERKNHMGQFDKAKKKREILQNHFRRKTNIPDFLITQIETKVYYLILKPNLKVLCSIGK